MPHHAKKSFFVALFLFTVPVNALAFTHEEATVQKEILTKISTHFSNITSSPPAGATVPNNITNSNTGLSTALSRLIIPDKANFKGTAKDNFEKELNDIKEMTKDLITLFENNNLIDSDDEEKIKEKLDSINDISNQVVFLKDQKEIFKKQVDQLKKYVDAIQDGKLTAAIEKNMRDLTNKNTELDTIIEKLETNALQTLDTSVKNEIKGLLTKVKEVLPQAKEVVAELISKDMGLEAKDKLLKSALDKLEKESRSFFDSPWWGVGLTVTIDQGNNDRVKDASIINGVVRVNKDDNVIPRFMLETHYFFKLNSFLNKAFHYGWFDEEKFTVGTETGIGPFFAVVPGDDVVDAFGGGLMVGFKRGKESNQSFNIGVGVVVDPNVQVLGDGFKPNQAPPPGETEVRFKETDQFGILVVGSFSF